MARNIPAAQLTVDLGALAENYRALAGRLSPDCRAAGVVKADAYGLGLEPVVAALEHENCPFYFVATLEEAMRLRGLTAKPVAVLNGLLPGTSAAFLRHDLLPVLNSLAMIELWRSAAREAGKALPALLHFDTGMSRLGLGPDETEVVIADRSLLDGIDLRLVMSHFACADEAHPLNGEQQARFAAIAAQFPGVPASLANSAGIFLGPATHYDLVRPGMALYGLNPTPDRPNPMRPVVTLETPILQIRQARAGETVGYGASHRLEKDTRLATVALGYADGFLRSLSGRGTLYLKGRPCPILGRVSMDLTIVELGDADARPGDLLEVIGPNQDADALATAAGTIGYEILTGLGPRYTRLCK